MPVKFLEIVEDPYKNASNEFILVLGIETLNTPNPSSPGTNYSFSGQLYDPNGVLVSVMWQAIYQDYEVTGTLSDEAFAHSWTRDVKSILIPPGFTFKDFTVASALQGTLEELAPFIRGM